MAISLQADSTLPQGYILVDGQRAATISTTGLSATLADGLVTTSALASGAVTTEKIAGGSVTGLKLSDGMTVQVAYSSTTTVQYVGQAIPVDNTKPQNTEGVEFLTASITPTTSTNKILVEVQVQGATENAGGTIILALFKNNDASAIATSIQSYGAQWGTQILLTHQDSPATTSLTTYKLRVGYVLGGGSMFINGSSSGTGLLGDTTLSSFIKLTEIKAT
jgi:hypothetical protein